MLLFVVDLIIEVLIKRVVEYRLIVLHSFLEGFADLHFVFCSDDHSRTCLLFGFTSLPHLFL